MLKNILVPDDGSIHSRSALEYGLWMAGCMGAKIRGIHVVDIVPLEGPFFHDISASLGFEPNLNFSDKMREVLELKGKEILENLEATCMDRGIAHDSCLSTGLVVNEVCKAARNNDIVIMGRRGLNAEFEYGLLGSTTEGVVRRSPKPVIVVPDQFIKPANPLLAYDGSVSSSEAMHNAAEFSKTLGLSLSVLTVASKDEGRELIDNASIYLEPYEIKISFANRHGSACDEIVRYYNEKGHDMLFVGASHHSRIVEMVLGSTTEYVMRAVDTPVFISR